MNEKKLLKILVGLLIALILHNLYLNYELLQIKNYAIDAYESANAAENYSYKASQNAEEALIYAQRAAEYSSDAASNAYGNNCSFCP